MALLVAGLLLFVVAHGLKIHAPAARARLVGQIGEMPVKIGMTVALVLSVILMAKGYAMATPTILWTSPAWTVHLNNLLMLIAIGVFIAGKIPSVVRTKIRHPQLTAVKIWSLAHLLVNGDVPSLVLFGGMLAWAVAAMIGVNKRDGKGRKPTEHTLAGSAIHAGATLGVFVAVALAHNWLGVYPFG